MVQDGRVREKGAAVRTRLVLIVGGVDVCKSLDRIVGDSSNTAKNLESYYSKHRYDLIHLNAVVPRPPKKVFPRRMPTASKKENFRTVMTALPPSVPNQLFPAHSAPAGHRMFVMLSKPDSVEEGPASIWAS